MRSRMFLLAASVAAGLIGLGNAHAGDLMSGDQIKQLVSGNTSYGKSETKDRHGLLQS